MLNSYVVLNKCIQINGTLVDVFVSIDDRCVRILPRADVHLYKYKTIIIICLLRNGIVCKKKFSCEITGFDLSYLFPVPAIVVGGTPISSFNLHNRHNNYS